MSIKVKKLDYLPNQIKSLDERRNPVILKEDFLRRIENLFCVAKDKYTHFVIYGDREHFSNIEFFTGIDPRFEEFLLVLENNNNVPTIIVGDEGCDYANKIPYKINVEIFHGFSLPNQPRREKTILKDILRKTGLNEQSKVALIGWKWFDESDFDDDAPKFDFPSFILQEIFSICDPKSIFNGTYLMQDNVIGLRNNLSAKEMIMAEIAGTKSSRATMRVLQNLKEGISELEASYFLRIDGSPINVHPNINFGENYFYALASPTHDNLLKKGDVVGVGMAYRRSLCHKVGIFVNDESELEKNRRVEAEELFFKYFEGLKNWYESIKIGFTGHQVYQSVTSVIGDPFEFGIGLNLGHGIHTDEWVNTLFYENSEEKLHSGMLLQCDFTAAVKSKNIAVHAEDGILIADEALQEEIKRLNPDSYERMINRREFMKNQLGINLAKEVLPTSDLSGIVFPYLGNLSSVVAFID